MTKKGSHKEIDICGNCTFSRLVWYADDGEIITCTAEQSVHCGHILTKDHFFCETGNMSSYVEERKEGD